MTTTIVVLIGVINVILLTLAYSTSRDKIQAAEVLLIAVTVNLYAILVCLALLLGQATP